MVADTLAVDSPRAFFLLGFISGIISCALVFKETLLLTKSLLDKKIIDKSIYIQTILLSQYLKPKIFDFTDKVRYKEIVMLSTR